MEQIKAYMAEHEIAKTLYGWTQLILIFGLCLGTAPALIWLTRLSY